MPAFHTIVPFIALFNSILSLYSLSLFLHSNFVYSSSSTTTFSLRQQPFHGVIGIKKRCNEQIVDAFILLLLLLWNIERENVYAKQKSNYSTIEHTENDQNVWLSKHGLNSTYCVNKQ